MNKSPCLGLIGGLGIGATTHYYRELAKAHQERGRMLDMVIVHADMSQVFAHVQANDRSGLAEYLISFIQRLKAAGAEMAAIPAVTPHFCVRELIAASPLPLFNIFDPLVRKLEAQAVQRVAVFGTRFVMESKLFGLIGGVEIVPASQDEADSIHQTYTALAQEGKGTEEQHRNLTALAHTLRQRDGVEAVILAGTDLSLLFNPANTDFPCIDCAALHLEAILNGLLSQA